MKTVIGYGSKLQGTNAVHGAPLGDEDGRMLNHNMDGIMSHLRYQLKFIIILMKQLKNVDKLLIRCGMNYLQVTQKLIQN